MAHADSLPRSQGKVEHISPQTRSSASFAAAGYLSPREGRNAVRHDGGPGSIPFGFIPRQTPLIWISKLSSTIGPRISATRADWSARFRRRENAGSRSQTKTSPSDIIIENLRNRCGRGGQAGFLGHGRRLPARRHRTGPPSRSRNHRRVKVRPGEPTFLGNPGTRRGRRARRLHAGKRR